MKLPLSLMLVFVVPLITLSQVLTIQNGNKTKEFWEGSYVDVWTCTSCNPDIMDDCIGSYDSYDGLLKKVGMDSLILEVFSSRKFRTEAGTSYKMETIKYKDERMRLALPLEEIDLIRNSKPPAVQTIKKGGAVIGCILLTLGIGEYLNDLSDPDARITDNFTDPIPNATILIGGLGLLQFYRKKYYLTPLLKGSQSKQVWNIQ
ncbi:MAG: hypothetical protein MRZ79_23925 [Bacteroidia bacterium]|nr:hypothetical protein [Bacteroidia bacterium]